MLKKYSTITTIGIINFLFISVVNSHENEMHHKIEALPNSHGSLDEGPHWDAATQSLYFVDIFGPKLYRYDYAENKTYQATIANETFSSFVIPIENEINQFAVGLGQRVGKVEWDGKSSNAKVISTIFSVESDDEKYKLNRFNDAKADPMGRFFGGTMGVEKPGAPWTGSFYKFEKGNTEPVVLKSNVGTSNGLVWNLKTKKFYYIDSLALSILEYDYNVDSGEIKNPKVLIEFKDKNNENDLFLPDGMTIDNEGNLYVGIWGGWKLLKISPVTGKIVQEIDMPCRKVTSAAFGGPDLDILFVTTAEFENEDFPAGNTFKITGLGTKGLPMNKLKL